MTLPIVLWTIMAVLSCGLTVGALVKTRLADRSTKGGLWLSTLSTVPSSAVLFQVLTEKWPVRSEPSLMNWVWLWWIVGPALLLFSWAVLPARPVRQAWLPVRLVHVVTWLVGGICAGMRAMMV